MERPVACNPRYLITSDGVVINKRTGLRLKPQKARHGYLRVNIWDGTKIMQRPIHRLVAIAFLDQPEGHNEVNHKNFDKTDNRVENLEWCTRSQNVRHAIAGGRSHLKRR